MELAEEEPEQRKKEKKERTKRTFIESTLFEYCSAITDDDQRGVRGSNIISFAFGAGGLCVLLVLRESASRHSQIAICDL